MGLEWKLLGAMGYGLPLASGVLLAAASAGINANLKLSIFLWLVGLLFIGLAWVLLGWDTRQKGYVLMGIIALLAFFFNSYALGMSSELLAHTFKFEIGLRPFPSSTLWAFTVSAFLLLLYILLEMVGMIHAGSTYGERFLRWSAWAKAFSLGLLTLALLSFFPMIGNLLEMIASEGTVNPASFLVPLISFIASMITYMVSTIFAMIGFLDLKVNKGMEGEGVGRA